jgi:superoxide dismutase
MKILGQTKALSKLHNLKAEFQDFVKTNYEHRAKNCLTCETKGACCTDVHFVNVHVTRLEALAIQKTLENLSEEKQIEIYRRAEAAVEEYDLNNSNDSFAKTFACPLFEKNFGCLVHRDAKPAPCISHACYENQEDLPPDESQEEIENQIEKLNKRIFGNAWTWLPIPVWLDLANPFKNKTAQNNKKSAR